MSVTIQTERLELRPYRAEDAPVLTALIGNRNITRWLPRVPFPYTQDDALAFITRDRSGDQALAITLEGDLIGGCGIDEELGYWLAEPFWGNGYASEAARALIDRYFDRTDTDLMSGHRMGNEPSRRVLSKLGFADTELVWRHSFTENTDVEIQRMVLTPRQWRVSR